ncbi:uncharacterized protein LOC126590626 [Malus sylvestris]|uniref:uncharacterized protein LOC126590626 n=1 Tax=Malus sylvestris TaxID=3752 RepID=UPI0021AC46C7|nr:uncharacterized protein LOC126590626 [Malus sylvestris]
MFYIVDSLIEAALSLFRCIRSRFAGIWLLLELKKVKLSFERGKKGKGHGKRTKREQKNGFCYFNALEIQSMQRSRVENRATLAQRNDSHHPTNATAAISIVVLEESHRFTNSSGGPVIFWSCNKRSVMWSNQWLSV